MGNSKQNLIEINVCPKSKDAIDDLVQEKIVTLDHSETGQSLRSKKIHDVDQAIRRFEICLKSIENGYKFDDLDAGERLRLMREALEILKKESQILTKIYR